MNAGTFLERRVNSFAAHQLLPVKAVTATMAWLGATADDIADATARGQVAIGYLMVRYGVSMPCALGQLMDAGFVKLPRKAELTAELHAGALVGEAALVDHRRRNATVITASEVRALRLGYEDLTAVFAKHGDLEQVFRTEWERKTTV